MPFEVSHAVSVHFTAYFEAFNAHDLDRLMPFWSPGCRFRTRPGFADLEGREDICRFYQNLWEKADERIDLRGLTAEDDTVLAEIETAIVAREDMPDFGESGLAAGDRLTLRSIVAYRLHDDAITHIEGRSLLARTIEKSGGDTPGQQTESVHV